MQNSWVHTSSTWGPGEAVSGSQPEHDMVLSHWVLLRTDLLLHPPRIRSPLGESMTYLPVSRYWSLNIIFLGPQCTLSVVHSTCLLFLQSFLKLYLKVLLLFCFWGWAFCSGRSFLCSPVTGPDGSVSTRIVPLTIWFPPTIFLISTIKHVVCFL